MARGYSLTVKCKHPGCNEFGHWEYPRVSEYREGAIRHKDYKCLRHSDEARVLSAESPEKTVVFVAEAKNGHNYWRQEGAEHLSSGFMHGPGFMAWASDFKPGPRIEVVAKLTPAE